MMPSAETLEARLAILPDGSVVGRSGKVEYGQNIRTGFALILAEELDVAPALIRMEMGETESVPWDMGTFGSMSTALDGAALRRAGAHARGELLRRAVRHFNLPETELATRDGAVHASDGRSVTYAELVRGAPLAGPVPEHVATRQRAPADIPARRFEARDIVTGRLRYAADTRLPGMLFAGVLHPPLPGMKLAACNRAALAAMPGIVALVDLPDGLAIVAAGEAQVHGALEAAVPDWREPPPPREEQWSIGLRQDAGAAAALQAPAPLYRAAQYEVAHITHAPLAPSAACADVRPDAVDLHVATQRPFALRDEVARLLGRDPAQVHVHPCAMGGMYGRGNMNMAGLQAARISAALGRPVLVQWTRADEFLRSPARPRVFAELAATLDGQGGIAAWSCAITTSPSTFIPGPEAERSVAMGAGRCGMPPYRLGAADIALSVAWDAIPTGALRSLGAAPNVFAIESFIDELADAAGLDPLEFRRRHTDDARLAAVLEHLAGQSGWAGREDAAGIGHGVACCIYNGTRIAQAVRVAVEPAGRIRVARVWCSVDAGHIVHLDGARNQVEGSVQQAASWALLEELKVVRGRPAAESWRDYPIARFSAAIPEISVDFIGDPAIPSSGLGEPGAVPLAAAIANAVQDATGIRLRRLPLRLPARA